MASDKPSAHEAQKMFSVVVSFSFLLLLALVIYAVRRGGQHSFLPEAKEKFFSEPLRENASLFAPTIESLAQIEREDKRKKLCEEREKLLEWASLIHFNELNSVHTLNDKQLWSKNLTESWNEALAILTERAKSEQDVRTLVSFVLSNKFNVNKNLVESYQPIWEKAPTFETTADLFELAAMADDADLFLAFVIQAEQFIKTRQLDLSKNELYDLAESHHWLLSNSARTSGAGFLLKQKLADLRREITHN